MKLTDYHFTNFGALGWKVHWIDPVTGDPTFVGRFDTLSKARAAAREDMIARQHS